MIVLKDLKGNNVAYFEDLITAVRFAAPYVFYGVQLLVYKYNPNGKDTPYYLDNTAMSLHRNNINNWIAILNN